MGVRVPRRRRPVVLAFLILLISLFLFLNAFPFFFIDIGYLTRWLWDEPNASWTTHITHYYAEGMTMQDRCEAHGWTLRPDTAPKPRLIDATIFSVELDMLEIRMRELYDVVDAFVILESNATFTGTPKDEVFKMNRARFAFAEDKIWYKSIVQQPLHSKRTAWDNEGEMRQEMTSFLEHDVHVQDGDLVMFADVDEIVNRQTAELLKSCEGIPQKMHLLLKNYMFSYEYPVGDEGMWRPSIQRWESGVIYGHSQHSEILFHDAGWHCSFCFRSVEEFKFKMLAYSHADRVRYSYMKESDWIQASICKGSDLFGMYPEAYTFQDLIARLGPIARSHSAVGLPKWVLQNRQKFKFLLPGVPGGCTREKLRS